MQNQVIGMYNKLTVWGKVLLLLSIFLIVVVFFKNLYMSKMLKEKGGGGKEGFEQNDTFLNKEGTAVYDDFYATIYDHLVFNNMKDDYEVGEILNNTKPTDESIILDVGTGTGHHVSKLSDQGLNVTGVDVSQAMVKQSKENYPQYNFVQGDVMNATLFQPNSYTHILCMYFTIYYFENKSKFFKNCMQWLMPGGYIVLHLVDREMFDPILPPSNPLLLVSPQRYAKERITQSKITFNNMDYVANFELDKNKNIGTFNEKFKHRDTGKVRQNKHIMFMDTHKNILSQAQNAGFILHGKTDLVKVAYEYQYIYYLQKPN